MKKFGSSGPGEWLARIGAIVVFLIALAVSIALSAVFFALFAAVALILGGWFWWKTRHLRRQMRQQQEDIVEVEYQVLQEDPLEKNRLEEEPSPRRKQSGS